ncbi:MAG: InlB B-repeat-containing protein, partial [Acetatifactor sp.]|nr:InlB B-repeat-containing protein [Acetatifactor sp.]
GGKTEASVLSVAFAQRPGVTAPERNGYDFAGWYTDAACTEENLFSTETAPAMPDRDLTLYAKWTPKGGIAYKVEHYRQDVSGDGYTLFETEDKTGTTGASVTATAKSYEHFNPNNSAVGAVPTGEIAADGSLVLKLYYDRETFTVTYDPDGGTLAGNETERIFRYGAAFSAPDVTRAGYGLDGWFDGTVKYDSAKTITANVAVTARWIAGAANYKVEHYQQDTDGVYPDDPSYTDTRSGTAGAAIDLDALKRDDTGFAFDKSGEASYTIDGDGSTVVKLYYTRNKHTLTWNLGGGTAQGGYTQGEVYYGATVMAPAVTKTGYICTWDSTPPVTMPDNDLTLTASWTPITYTVKFDLNGGSMAEGVEPLEDVTIKYDETYTLPASGDITREYYGIKGWSTNRNSTEAEFEPSETLSGLTAEDGATVTLYVLWTPVKYHFDFYHNGGTIEDGNVSGEYYRYDYTIEDIKAGPIQLPDITMKNYDFLG